MPRRRYRPAMVGIVTAFLAGVAATVGAALAAVRWGGHPDRTNAR